MTRSTNEIMRNLEERPLQRGRRGWEDNMKMRVSLLYPKDEGSMFLRDVGNLLPVYMASHPEIW
jgi:hypothetical protein